MQYSFEKIGIRYQYASQYAVCAYAHDFWKRAGCMLIGACALIRMFTVICINCKWYKTKFVTILLK